MRGARGARGASGASRVSGTSRASRARTPWLPKPLLALSLAVLAGCSLLPSEKQQSQSVKSTEAISVSQDRTIERALEVVPEMGLRIASNSPVIVRDLMNLPPPQTAISSYPSAIRETLSIHESSGQQGGSHDAATGTSSVSIPLGVKIALLGIGIFILLGALIWGWKYIKTTAFGQGVSLADSLAASQIQKLRERASLATDPAQQAQYLSDIAALEAARGKLAAK